MSKSVFKVICLKDCSSMFAKFYKGKVYRCEVLYGNYVEKVKIWGNKDFIHYIFDNNGEILTLDWQFDDFFMDLGEYRKLKLERLNSL